MTYLHLDFSLKLEIIKINYYAQHRIKLIASPSPLTKILADFLNVAYVPTHIKPSHRHFECSDLFVGMYREVSQPNIILFTIIVSIT